MACIQNVLLKLYQGSTFTRRIVYTDSNNTPIDLTDYGIRMYVRPSVGSNIAYFKITTTPTPDGTGINKTPTSASVVLPPSSGSFLLTISAYSSSLVNFDAAYFDMEIYSGSGDSTYVRRIMSGKMKMYREVTP